MNVAVAVDYSSSSLGDERLELDFERALTKVRTDPSPVHENVVGGETRASDVLIERFDPCHPSIRVGAAYEATDLDVADAVAAARGAAKAWRATEIADRVARLRAAKDHVDSSIVEIAAIVSAETGKNRLEAIGETQEVVDMIEHYCDQLLANEGFRAQQRSTATETNEDLLVPYGTFAVIAPFNFPVALSTNMTISALLTGNTVVLKPSEKTPRSTAVIADIFRSNLPPGVLNVVHGGASTGRALAAAPVDGIAFTGSADVGWQLIESAASQQPPRPVLAEMGGQNPAIVTATANLDDAVSGIVRSAFGFSGQKCSACRRVIVDRSVAPALVERLVAAANQLAVGDPMDRASALGPVIDDAIGGRVDAALQTAEREGVVLTGGRVDRNGNFFRPTVVAGLPLGHPLTRDELFAPFLTVIEVDDLDAAIAEANATNYGLSAGIFSSEQSELDQFLDEIEAGVLYVNRAAGATTGAWPGVQSFCGWKRSGSTGKGGLGLWYLQGFMREQNRTVVVGK